MKEEELLIGKTIIGAKIEKISENYDDEPYLFLTMLDGTVFKIVSYYGRYTGKSEDEYPCFIGVNLLKDEKEMLGK